MDKEYKKQFFRYSQLLMQRAQLIAMHKQDSSEVHAQELNELEIECQQAKIILDSLRVPRIKKRRR